MMALYALAAVAGSVAATASFHSLAGPTINLVLNLTGASLFQVVAIASAIALAAAMLAAALPSAPTGAPGRAQEAIYMRDGSKALPPWPALRFGLWLTSTLENVQRTLKPAPIRAIDEMSGYARCQTLYVLAKLGIADRLAAGPKTAEQLAAETGVPTADHLFRVLRLAVRYGFVTGGVDTASGKVVFWNNALTSALREDHPNSVRALACHHMEDCYGPWSKLLPGLLTDKVPAHLWLREVTGKDMDVWQYLAENPAREEQFSRAMTSVDNLGKAALLADFAWSRFDQIFDIGGAYGSMLAGVLEANPAAKGVLFDLPQVAERAKAVWAEKHPHLLSRTTIVGGSFLRKGSVPKAASAKSVYLLRGVLHDWNDDETMHILRHIRAAIGSSGAHLAIMECTPGEGFAETFSARVFVDVHMLTVCDGKERTAEQWNPLFAAVGFKLIGVTDTRSPMKVIEAVGV